MSPERRGCPVDAAKDKVSPIATWLPVGESVLIFVASSRSPLTTKRLFSFICVGSSDLSMSTHRVGIIRRSGLAARIVWNSSLVILRIFV